jgi:hypothetical protein
VSETEYDVLGTQDEAYKIAKDLRKAGKGKGKVHLYPLINKEWKQFYENLWTNKEEILKLANDDENIDPILLEGSLIVLKHFKSKEISL